MKRTVLSAMLATGALAAAALMAVPALTAGTSSTPSRQDVDTENPLGISLQANDIPGNEYVTDMFSYLSEIFPTPDTPLPDNPQEIKVKFLADNVELNQNASSLDITVIGQEEDPKEGNDGKISKALHAEVEQDKEGIWILNFPSLNLEYGKYTVTIPEGFWKEDGVDMPSLSLSYKMGYKIVKPIEANSSASSIYGANYYYTDKEGSTFGYHLDWNIQNYDYYAEEPEGDYSIQNAKFCGVITKASQIEFWPFVKVEDVEPIEVSEWWGTKVIKVRSADSRAGITSAEFHHDIVNGGVETSFPMPSGYEDVDDYMLHPLKDVYLPNVINNVNWTGKFQTCTVKFHFKSYNVPDFIFDEYANGKIIVYVPDRLYHHYSDYVKEHYPNYTIVVRNEDPLTPIYVNVSEPGTLAVELSKLVKNLDDARWVIVTGTPDEEDLRFFRRLPYLEILDLSQTDGLKEISGCNELKYLREVNLPENGTISKIGEKAFQNCISLETINMPDGVESIESHAFHNTSSLGELRLPESLKTIGLEAFSSSSIHSINLECVESFDHYAFGYCRNLVNINLGDNLKSIAYDAFSVCPIKELKLPNCPYRIGSNAFVGNFNLIEFAPNNNISLDRLSFGGASPDTIVVKYLFPLNVSGFSDEGLRIATTYVPKLTYNDFLLSDAWAACPDIRPLEEDLDEINVDRYFNLRSETGLTEKSTVNLLKGNTDSYGQLTVRRKVDLNLGRFEMIGIIYTGRLWTNEGSGYNGCTFLPKSKVTSDDAVVTITLQNDRWHFLTFPFDIKVTDIEVEDEALWVVRKYSGEDRAKMTGNTWQNLQSDDILKAGEGYIFHCTKENGDTKFIFRADASVNAGLFNFENTHTELEAHPSEFAHNAHWNLVGNSYPAYLSLKGVNFDAPVTVWDGSTYVAYSPVDDEYAFSPFQAFFVQLQEIEGGDVLTLDARARAHSREEALALEIEADEENPSTQAERPMLRARRAENRALFNLVLSDGQSADRARLVVNEAASMAYEPSRDASKFMSFDNNNVPQLFIMNDGERMAIDERPFGEGVYTLGARFGHSGEYSISLDGKNIEGYRAFLTDNLTGVTTEITTVAYAFTADAATDEARFTLELRRDFTTGVEDMEADGIIISAENGVLTVKAPAEVEITVAAADGKVVAIDKSADFNVELSEGVYVVKAGEAIKKINIR